MALNQDIQSRVYQEIISCFGDSNRPCGLEDLLTLKYLDCCVKESLRLYPPAPLIRRRVDHEIEADSSKIPAGTNFALQIYALHRNEQFFIDSLRYDHERFSTDNSVGRHPFSFVPFTAGPRNCMDQKFGLYEDKVIPVNLLREFHFDINPGNIPVRSIQHRSKASRRDAVDCYAANFIRESTSSLKYKRSFSKNQLERFPPKKLCIFKELIQATDIRIMDFKISLKLDKSFKIIDCKKV